MIYKAKHHIIAIHEHGFRIALCGKMTSKLDDHFHNEFYHLPDDVKMSMCLSCLKNMNTRASWYLLNAIKASKKK